MWLSLCPHEQDLPCWKKNKNSIDQHDFHAGICWLVLICCWFSWWTSMMKLVLAGDVTDEAGHQHPMMVLVCWSPASHEPAWEVSLPMLAGNTCAWVLFNQHLDMPHLSAWWLILLDFNKCVLSIWKKWIICLHTKASTYPHQHGILVISILAPKHNICWSCWSGHQLCWSILVFPAGYLSLHN